MKQWLKVCVMCILLGPLGAMALESDKQAPTTIEADKMTYDDIKQVNVFTGSVVLVKGTILLRGDRLTVRQTPEGFQLGLAEGKPATFRQKREGPGDPYIDGEGERIDYDGKAETVIFQRKAILRKLNGTQVTDEVKGDNITYLQRTEYFTVLSDQGNATTPGGRVKAVLQPKEAGTPATETKKIPDSNPLKTEPTFKSAK